MLRGVTDRLLSRNAAVAALGFVLSLIGALGGAFYLEPAQKTRGRGGATDRAGVGAGANASSRHVLR